MSIEPMLWKNKTNFLCPYCTRFNQGNYNALDMCSCPLKVHGTKPKIAMYQPNLQIKAGPLPKAPLNILVLIFVLIFTHHSKFVVIKKSVDTKSLDDLSLIFAGPIEIMVGPFPPTVLMRVLRQTYIKIFLWKWLLWWRDDGKNFINRENSLELH